MLMNVSSSLHANPLEIKLGWNMRLLPAVMLFMFPSAAAAQSSTTCVTDGNVTNCERQPGKATPLDYSAQLEAGRRLVPDYAESQMRRAQIEALRAGNRESQERLACRKKAMAAIDAGEYEKAKALAALCP